MKAPRFWNKPGGVSYLLSPLSWIYKFFYQLRRRFTRLHTFSKPVLCIGNVTVGGVGKTPLVRWIAAHYRVQGVKAGVVLRGYGGKLKGPLQVDFLHHTARDVGDEALLHALDGPTWMSKDRALGIDAAFAAGMDLVILDDGLQNPTLQPSAALVVVDGIQGFGNGCLLPAGPLRESVEAALSRVDGVVVMGESASSPFNLALEGKVYTKATVFPCPTWVPPTGPVIAFAGLGNPEKFFDFLRSQGVALAKAVAFPDHHLYRTDEINHLLSLSHILGIPLITTEKDWVRLAPEVRAEVERVPITLHLSPEAGLIEFLEKVRYAPSI